MFELKNPRVNPHAYGFLASHAASHKVYVRAHSERHLRLARQAYCLPSPVVIAAALYSLVRELSIDKCCTAGEQQ